MNHKTAALITIAAAAVSAVIGGLAFAAAEHINAGLGLYYAVTTATTTGYGDITPKTNAGHYIAVTLMLTAIPLFSVTFSLLTAALTTSRIHLHMKGQEERLKKHIEDQLTHHLSEGAE